jgi:hypothetical protein
MRRLALICGALAISLIPVATAGAQDTGFSTSIIFTAPGARAVKELQLQVSLSGAVAADYHGSAAAGCERMGLCEVSGTTTWDPGRTGFLQLEKFVQHGKRRVTGFLITQGRTAAEVTRRSPGLPAAVCGDARAGLGGIASAHSKSLAALSFRLVDTRAADFLSSRCAGPLSEDLAKLLPVRPLTHSVFDGKTTKVIDLSTVRPFSTGGFAGTLRSTVVVRVGPEIRRPPGYEQVFKELEADLKKHLKPYRELEARYKITQVAGSLSLAFRGASDAGLCADLDSCGATGSTVFEPQGSSGELELDAYLPKHRPWRDLRTTFGLARGGRTEGTQLVGSGEWRSDSGSLTSTVVRADGSATCNDSVPLRAGDLYMFQRGATVLLSYTVGSGFGDITQTHCPGPLLSDLPLFGRTAQATVPVTVLKKRSVTLHLKLPPQHFGIAGYDATSNQDLTVKLRRIGVRKRTAKLL